MHGLWSASRESGSLLKKGMRVYVSGRLEARPWTAQDGQVRAGLELVADTVEFLSQKNDQQRQAGADDDLSDVPF